MYETILLTSFFEKSFLTLYDNDLNKLIDKRSKIYAKANYQIKCDKLSKIEIVNKIMELNEKD